MTSPTGGPDVADRASSGTAEPWVLCPGCRTLQYTRRLARALRVCPDCGWHHRLAAPERIAQLLDAGSVQPLGVRPRPVDPLGFVDTRPYPQRVDAARAATGLDEAVVVVCGTVEGIPVVAAVMDFRFLGGSLGSAVGELVTRAAECALRERVPLLVVTASGGARMQEGAVALMQLAKTSQALGQLDEAGVPTVALVTDPTYGGVAASYATLCDVIVAEPRARMGFAGPRVIAQTIRESLPRGFQTAEFLLERGFVDVVAPRAALRPTLARLLSAGARRVVGSGCGGLPGGDRPGHPGHAPVRTELVRDPDRLAPKDAWQAVREARDLGRPTTLDYVTRICTDFQELHGDRLGGDCPAVVGGVGRLDGMPVVLVGHQKGHTPGELAARGFGMATPAGQRKAARLMRLAAKWGLPVVTLVDTPGAHPGVPAEEQGQAAAIAENLRLMAGLPVPVVSVVVGEGGSGGALALAVADRILALSGAVYSVISPEGCAAILWNDRGRAAQAAAALRLRAADLLRLGVVDAVVPEPPGGAQADHGLTAERLRAALAAVLRELAATDPAERVARRRARFRSYGTEAVVGGQAAATGRGGDETRRAGRH